MKERPPLALQLIFLGRHLDRLVERRLAEQGLNRTQTVILIALSRRPGLRALELCPHAGVEPANVTRTLQSLERLGLLVRHSHPTDGRASLLYLTGPGHALAQELSAAVHHLSADLLRGVPPRDLARLERSLAAVRDNLRRVMAGSRPSSCMPIGDEDTEELPREKSTG